MNLVTVVTFLALAGSAAGCALEPEAEPEAIDPEPEEADPEPEEADPEPEAPEPEAIDLAVLAAIATLDDKQISPVPAAPRGAACRIACKAAVSAGCIGVTGLCASATAITLGGISVPCAWAFTVTCTGAVAGAQACDEFCPR